MLFEAYEKERERIAALGIEDADILHPVFGEGDENSPLIMFIGEAPGREEAACGRPFVGKAGRQLDRMLELAGIDRSKVFVTNSVKYRPTKLREHRTSNRTPTVKEVRDGLELLAFEIETVKPEVIATLGSVPLSAVKQLSPVVDDGLVIGSAHGMPTMILLRTGPQKLFPLYHPAAAIYNRALAPVLDADLIRLGEYAGSLN